MQLTTPPHEVSLAGLRAMKTVALVDGEWHALERGLLQGAQKHILKTEIDCDALEAITPDALAEAVQAPEFRERILSACILVALIDGAPSAREGELLERFARALDVPSPALRDLKRMLDDQLLIARIDIARRSFLGQRGRAYLAEHGIRGLSRTLRSLLDIEDPALAARYRSLEHYAPGTLGREYFEFIRRSGFSLPGEAHGAPEVIAFHDCLHVLAGYGTSSIEETQIASFQAGMLKRDAVFGLLFMLAQFHLGLQITPVTPAEHMVADPELMLAAFARGAKVNRDLCTEWNPGADFERSVEELRRAYNIEPRA